MFLISIPWRRPLTNTGMLLSVLSVNWKEHYTHSKSAGFHVGRFSIINQIKIVTNAVFYSSYKMLFVGFFFKLNTLLSP